MANQYMVGNAPAGASYAAPLVGFQIGDRLADLPNQYFLGQQQKRTLALQQPILDPNTGKPTQDPNIIFPELLRRGGAEYAEKMMPFLFGQQQGQQSSDTIMQGLRAAYPDVYGAPSGASGAGTNGPPNAAGPRNLTPPPSQRSPAPIQSAGTGSPSGQSVRSLGSSMIPKDMPQAVRERIFANAAAPLGVDTEADLDPQQQSQAHTSLSNQIAAWRGGSTTPGGRNPSAVTAGPSESDGRGLAAATTPQGGVGGSPGPSQGGGGQTQQGPLAGQGNTSANSAVPTTGPGPGNPKPPQVAGQPAPSIMGTGERAAIQNLRVLAGTYRAAAARADAMPTPPGAQPQGANLRAQAESFDKQADQREAALLAAEAPNRAAATTLEGGNKPAAVKAGETLASKDAEYYDAEYHRMQGAATHISQTILPTVQLAQAALRDTNFGPMDLTKMRTYAAQFGATDPNSVVNEESFNKLMSSLLMDQITQIAKSGGGAGGTSGAGRGMAQLLGLARAAQGGTTTTTATNARLLEILRRASQDQVTVAGMAQAYANAHKDANGIGRLDQGWDQELTNYYKQEKNQPFSKGELADPRTIGAPTFNTRAEALAKLGPNQPFFMPDRTLHLTQTPR